MFKNFLTHQLAQSFDRACTGLLFEPEKERLELIRCSRSMLHHLQRSLCEKEPKELSRNLYATLMYLRDCRQILDAANITDFDVLGRWEVIHGRLEQMCLEASAGEKGQLRMLG